MIETAEAQGHATVFVAKFFGRAGLLSFISAVPDHQRPGTDRLSFKFQIWNLKNQAGVAVLVPFCCKSFGRILVKFLNYN
jgi:hypothetical protein